MLLAVMSVLVFVLPLYQLGLGLRNLVNTVRAKATQPFHGLRKLRCPRGPDLPETRGRELVFPLRAHQWVLGHHWVLG